MRRQNSNPAPSRDFALPPSKKQRKIAPVTVQDRIRNLQARNQKKEKEEK